MSQIGSQLSLTLHNTRSKLLVLEDLANIDSDNMKWHRWTELINAGIKTDIIDFKDVKIIKKAFYEISPSIVYYMPTLLLHPVTTGGGRLTHQLSHGSVIVKNFLHILQLHLLKDLPKPHFVLFSSVDSVTSPPHYKWFNVLESILLSYQKSHGTQFSSTIVRLPKLYGPWQELPLLPSVPLNSWYIDDAINVILNFNTSCTFISINDIASQARTSPTQAFAVTRKWYEEYIASSAKAKNVTIGAYFERLSTNYYHRKVNGNSFVYFRRWLLSSHQHAMHNILFHDSLNPEFIKRVGNTIGGITFLKVSARSNKAPNDQRYYYMYDYLIRHSDINMIVLADVKDVNFLNDPALVMSAVGDYFFVGKDSGYIMETGWIQRSDFDQCFQNSREWRTDEVMRSFGFLNSGLIGGTRGAILAALTYLTYCLDRTSNNNCCCDMSSVQYIFHIIFFEQLFIGYPFNTAFKVSSPGPFGMVAKHKDTFTDI